MMLPSFPSIDAPVFIPRRLLKAPSLSGGCSKGSGGRALRAILTIFVTSPTNQSLWTLVLFVTLFSACSNPPVAKHDTFGELDSTLIAADTAMEVNMDLSYEYHKSLVQNDTTVFDFLAYDKPKGQNSKEWESKFIVIKRTKASQDTVIKDHRLGPVEGLSITDLDQDGQPEILFYENQTATKSRWQVNIYTPGPKGKFKEIQWRELDAKSPVGHYNGGDTFFVYQDHLIRRFPYYAKSDDKKAQSTIWQSYILRNGKVTLDNEKTQ